MCQICGMNALTYNSFAAISASGGDATQAATSNQTPQWGGAGANFWASQSATSNINTNGVLSGSKWGGTTLTYSFPTVTTQYESGYTETTNSFMPAPVATQNAIRAAMNMVSAYTNLVTTEVDPATTTADVRVAFSNSANPTAYAYYPSDSNTGGDIWYGSNYPEYQNPIKGQYAWATSIHELGHSLGLKHGHQTGGVANTAMQSQYDQMAYSIMTYRSYQNGPTTGYTNELNGYAQTYMMYDIAALQTMYGANFNTNSGNSTYTWSSTTGEMFINGVGQGAPGGNRIFMTVWDGNGIDTYDFSNYTAGMTIDLTPGGFSLISTTQRAYLGNNGTNQYAPGNIFNALQYNGDVRSLIENAIGGSGNDTITGNAADNVLNGGAGADTMIGGAGNDTYYVDNAGDVVTETASNGWDSVYASFENYTLTANCEALVLTGSIIRGNGNSAANAIYGNAAANIIDGGAGADTMVGGAGNDTYYVDNLGDGVVENAGEGVWDVVYASVENYFLAANCEALVLNGSILAGFGNATGNVLYGNALGNYLDGLGGGDTLIGGDGNDTYVVRSATDVVTETSTGGNWDSVYTNFENYALAANCEALVLLNGVLAGFGNSGSNVLYGNALGNYLDGLGGGDTLIGGDGNDTYVVRSAADSVSETSTGGNWDSVYTNFEGYTLAANCEALVLLGGIATGYGNSGSNVLYGNALANTLDGGAGNDTLIGGDGNDTYYVDSTADSVVETSTGGVFDTVYATVSGYTLASNCEALVLAGSVVAGNGNAGGNVIYGNAVANFIVGLGGADTLFGGGGNDTFYYTATTDSSVGAGSDIIMDFAQGQDSINLSAIDASAGAGGDQAFSFIGNGGFTNVAGQLRYTNGSGDGLTHIYGDVNGDGVADFEIRLSGTFGLAGTDFVL